MIEDMVAALSGGGGEGGAAILPQQGRPKGRKNGNLTKQFTGRAGKACCRGLPEAAFECPLKQAGEPVTKLFRNCRTYIMFPRQYMLTTKHLVN
jgi:hypothetical protein